jgi:uncharacterized surface protein with fasciclin (FAS1) repeats
VVKYGIGTQLSRESEFTLLIPSDEAIGGLSLATWTKINDPQSNAFEKWYHKHHSAKRVSRDDVSGDKPIKELQVDDGASYALEVDESGLKINNVRVLIADVVWNKGIIHILSGDFPG